MPEEQNLTENNDVELNNATESSIVETNTSEPDNAESNEVDQPTEEEANQEEGEKKETGASKRIPGLVRDKKQLQEKVEDLSTKLETFTQGLNNYEPNTPNYGEGERDLTLDDLRALTRMEIEKEKAINRINNEAKEAVLKYPQLDPLSDSFDPDLNDSVTTTVYHAVRGNPTTSVTSLVDKLMKPFTKSVESAVASEKKELAKQAAESAMRPSSHVDKTEKSVEDMSIEEIKEKYGVVY
jgi:hypothetical protein